MWELVLVGTLDDKNPKRWQLLVGKECVIGRKDCQIVLPGDQTISRKHAIATVSHAESNVPHPHKPPILTVQDVSRFGSFVDGKKFTGSRILKHGEELRLGSLKSRLIAQYTAFITTTSCLENAQKKLVKASVCKMGGYVVSEWRKDCQLLIMSSINATIKVICALISQKPIVTPDYLKALLEAMEKGEEAPDTDKFLPPLAESQLDPAEVSFKEDNKRKTLFKDKRFIFLSPKQFKKLSIAIELAMGTPILMEEGSDDNDDEILISPGTCIMYSDPSDSSQSLSQNAQEWISHVLAYLRQHGKRAIPEAELGYAVLYCSTERYCNPDRDPVPRLFQNMPSQTLSQSAGNSMAMTQAEVLAPNTEISPQSSRQDSKRQLGNEGGISDISKIEETFLKPPDVKIKEEPISQSRAAASARDRSHGQSQSRAVASARDASQGQNGKRLTTSTRAALENLGENQPGGSMQNTDVNSNTITNGKTGDGSASNSVLPTAAGVGRTKRGREEEDPVAEPTAKTPKLEPVTPVPKPTSLRIKQEPLTPQISPKDHREENVNSLSREDKKVNQPSKKTGCENSDTRSNKQMDCNESTAQPNKGKVSKTENSSKVKGQNATSGVKVEVTVIEDDIDWDEFDEEIAEGSVIEAPSTSTSGGKEGSVQIPSTPPEGWLSSAKPSRALESHQDKEEDLPEKCVNVIFGEGMVVRKAKPKQQKGEPAPLKGNLVNWKGKMVKNFKKFKKNAAGVSCVPNVIGGRDLEVYNRSLNKDLEDWFTREKESQSQRADYDKEAEEMFGGLDRKTSSASVKGRTKGRKR